MSSSLATSNFGTVDFRDEDLILFPAGMPGFEQLHRFLLIDTAACEPLRFLQSIEQPEISFPVIDPLVLEPDYKVELTAEQRSNLELTDDSDLLIWCVVTVSEDALKATMNLLAPVVVNSDNSKAAQIVLLGQGYPIERPLMEAW